MVYEIFSDMSIDIEPEIAKRYGVRYIPMEVVLGERTQLVEAPPSMEEMHLYYDQLRQQVPTRTSQVTPYEYEQAFEPLVSEGRGILCIALSSGLSKTYESALLAVENLRDRFGENDVHIEVVDSLSATGGQGVLAEFAGINREDGLSLGDNAAFLRKYSHHLNHWFKVEDLMYLKRGGRISSATAVVGTALNIKPILTIAPDGTLETIAKKRGTKLATRYLAELVREYSEDVFIDEEGDASRLEHLRYMQNIVNVLGTDCPEDIEMLKSLVLEINPDAHIRITSVSPVIGAHTGPDMLAVIHMGRYRG